MLKAERAVYSRCRHRSKPIGARRRGFSVLEVMISVAIVVTLAVVIVPSVDLLIEKARMDLIEDQLRKIEDGITNFRDKISTNPGRLYHLSRPISAGEPTPCGTYTNQQVNAWAGTPPVGGPYINEVFPDGPIKIATFGTANPVLVRDPPSQGGTQRYAFLYYTISGVTRTDAIEINERIDGSADLDPNALNNLTGTIQWNNPDTDGFVTVTYRMLVPRNMC